MIFGSPRFATEKAVFRPALGMSTLPGISEMQMATKLTYSEQLKHPNWQRKRLETLEAHGWACRRCEAQDITLHVHHKQYIKGRMAWEYEDSDLDVLCESCHAVEHDHQDLLRRILNEARIMGHLAEQEPIVVAIGLVAGFFFGHFASAMDEGLAMEAAEAAPRSFNRGLMLAGLTGTVRVWDIAKAMREGHAATGQPMSEAVEKLLVAWETYPRDEGNGG